MPLACRGIDGFGPTYDYSACSDLDYDYGSCTPIEVPHPDSWKNVGRGSADLAIRTLPSVVLQAYCYDIATNTSKAEGQLAAQFVNWYTSAELEALGLYSRMDTKLAQTGGCSSYPPQ